jgi:hypothetical protein
MDMRLEEVLKWKLKNIGWIEDIKNYLMVAES